MTNTTNPTADREKLIANYCPEHGDLLNRPADGADARSQRCRNAHDIEEIHAALAAQPVLDLNAEKAEAWEEGVATALNHAKRGSDGITLKLVTFDGDAWPNPYREAAKRGELT